MDVDRCADPVERVRFALEAGDLVAARGSIGGVWHEREGLRKQLDEARARLDSYERGENS